MAVDSQSSPFGAIVLSIRDQIATVTGLDPAFVRIVASDNYAIDRCLEQQFVYLRVFGPEPDVDSGVGRRARRVWRTIRLYLYTRDSADETGVDELLLTAAGKHFWLEETVLDAIDEFFPDGTDPLTIEPVHVMNSDSGKPVREVEADIGLAVSHLDLSVSYVLANQSAVPTSPTSFLED